MYRFAFLIVAVTLLTSSTAQADLIYNNVSFANWSGTDGGTSRTGDMTFGGNTVGTVQLEAVNATEGFSTTFNSTENVVFDSGVFRSPPLVRYWQVALSIYPSMMLTIYPPPGLLRRSTISQRSNLSLTLDQHPRPFQVEAPLPSTLRTMIPLMAFGTLHTQKNGGSTWPEPRNSQPYTQPAPSAPPEIYKMSNSCSGFS